ncbi:MAG: Gfo/Idh/MocA family oxidoreductase [Spirochaetaceae bacterium]|nr:MAG: Gfo/Idh/MocA family oxidoreductase [Spirochaetaceae bacterium]
MDQDIKMGVLGLGRMGQVHCQLISDCPGLELVAGSSGSAELRRSAADSFAVRTYDSHEELLRDPQIGWIVIATTTNRHREWALKAIRAGKNLVIEKPIALTFGEAEEIIDAAERNDVRVTVYNSRRWDADFQFVRKTLAGESLGEVYRIESRYTDFDPGWGAWGAQGESNPWRLKKAYGGGILSDWGPHLFDQILLLVDSPFRSVHGRLYSKVWSEEVEDHFWSELLFDNGISVLVEASNNHRIPQPRWCIVGSEGTLTVQGGSPSAWNPALIRRSSEGGIEETRHELAHVELSTGYYRDLVKALQAGSPLPVQPLQVLRVMKIIEAVRESSAACSSVSISLA